MICNWKTRITYFKKSQNKMFGQLQSCLQHFKALKRTLSWGWEAGLLLNRHFLTLFYCKIPD